MNGLRSFETYSDLSDQTKFRLNEINKIKNYFISLVQERESINKKLSKSIASLDYMDKILIVLSATSGGISIISHLSVIGIPCRNNKLKFYFSIFLEYRNNKEIIGSNKKKEQKTK